jgi:hypothetical protein
VPGVSGVLCLWALIGVCVAQPTGADKPIAETARSAAQNSGETLPSAEGARSVTPAEVDRLVAAALERRTKDKEVVEVGLAMRAAGLLIDWAKIFGLFVVVPGALLAIFLGWFGISKYEDVRKILEQANAALAEVRNAAVQAHAALQEAQTKLASTSQIATEFDNQLQQLRSVVAANQQRIDSLGNAVKEMQQVLKFPADTVIAASVQDSMAKLVNEFFQYFKNLGYQPANNELKDITVSTEGEHHAAIAYYLPENNTIFVQPAYASSEYVILRQYSHHVLFEVVAAMQKQSNAAWIGVEYALADYFPGSFLDRARLEATDLANPEQSIVVDMDGDTRLTAETEGDAFNMRRVIQGQTAWRETLWEIRREVGQGIADQAVYQAWCSQPRKLDPAADRTFAVSLLRHARHLGKGEEEAAAREILLRRGLSPADLSEEAVAAARAPRRRSRRA